VGSILPKTNPVPSSPIVERQSHDTTHIAAPAKRKSVIVLDVTGSGIKTTQKFTVGEDWDLAWSYDCSGFSDGTGNFIVSVEGGNGTGHPAGVNQLGAGGHDVEHFHNGGQFYLEMNSECTWRVRAISL